MNQTREIEDIRQMLAELQPEQIQIKDESASHRGHYQKGQNDTYPSHLKIRIVSHMFNGMKLVQRHKMVNQLLKDAFENGLHALSLETIATNEIT